jgi:hypothetical protein
LTTLAQRTFSGGEIAPSLYARTDTQKYASGLKTCRNMFIMRHGGASNRPGTIFIGEAKDSTKTIRLVPFVFNTEQTYCLEFGDLYMRVIQDGAYLTDSTKSVTGGITTANPAVVTSTAHGFSNGDEIQMSGVSGAFGTFFNNRNFKVANVAANTFELNYMDGTPVDSSLFGTYSTGGTLKRVYTKTHGYDEADLFDLNFIQSADVIIITHQTYPPTELSRTGHTSWNFTEMDFSPTINRPTGLSASAGSGGSKTFRYKVTAVAQETFEESLTGFGSTNTLSSISKANPAVVTYNGSDNVVNGDTVYISGAVSSSGDFEALNNRSFTVANLNTGANTFELQGINTLAYTGSYTANSATISKNEATITSAADPSVSSPHTVTWTAATDTDGRPAQSYNIYRGINDYYGLIGVSGGTSFSDTGAIDPDTSDSPPIERNPFSSEDNYPSTATYFQQRLMFANTVNNPETVYASKTGSFKNFSISSPLQDDDAVTFSLAGRQVNSVEHLIDIGKLIVLTSGGEWSIEGSGGVLKPGEINPKQYSYNGAGGLQPLVVGGNALYQQARGSIVRDLTFDYQIDGYRGNDLTIFAAHLFEGYTLVDWAYQQIPNSIVWVVRSDGVLLGLTYVREHQVWAWHKHDTDGTIESVCSIPEGTEDALYVVVNRTIDGSSKRYIERFASRFITDIKDAVFMDSGLTYDGRHTGTTTMTITGGHTITGATQANPCVVTSSSHGFQNGDTVYILGVSGMTQLNGNSYTVAGVTTNTFQLSGVNSTGYGAYTSGGTVSTYKYDDSVKITASASAFASSDVGKEVHITEADGEVLRISIDSYTSSTVVVGKPNRTIPVASRNAALGTWGLAVNEVSGLWHLEGHEVSVFGDGLVESNPNNDAYVLITVEYGSISLSQHYTVIHAGMPYISDLQTLNIDQDGQSSIGDKKKIIHKVSAFVEASRGIFAGPKAPSDDTTDPLENLFELKIRDTEGYDDPVSSVTEVVDINIMPEWNSTGSVFIRQIDPLPLSVLSILPSGLITSGGK